MTYGFVLNSEYCGFRPSDGGFWHDAPAPLTARGYTSALAEFSDTLPEGEHIVGILVVGDTGTAHLRLARVTRSLPAAPLTTAVEQLPTLDI
jgi:hypothetical protein